MSWTEGLDEAEILKRRAMADRGRALAREIAVSDRQREAERTGKPVAEVKVETPLETLERLKTAFQAPVRLSSAARRTFGLKPEPPPAAPGWDEEAA